MKGVLKNGYWCLEELTRQTPQPIRRLMLDDLKRHIRQPGLVDAEPAQIPFSESQSPLAKYLK